MFKSLVVAALIVPCLAKLKIPDHRPKSTTTMNPPTTSPEPCPGPIVPNPNPTTTCPCDLEDLKCIGEVLAEHSTCKDQFMWNCVPIDQFTMYNVLDEIPVFNVTNFNKYITFSNLEKCVVAKFLVSDERKSSLLAFECTEVEVEFEGGNILHKSLEFDEYFRFNVKVNISLLRMTANMPHHDLCSAYVFCELPPLMPTIQAHDKKTQEYLDGIQDLIVKQAAIFTNEIFNYQGGADSGIGSSLFTFLVNSKISNCDCPAAAA